MGATLSLEERMKLELAMVKTTETFNDKEKYDQILFWGKIEGLTKDYYIAVALKFKDQFEFPMKKFYWSSNNFIFKELPEIDPEYKDKVDEFRQYFTGNFDKVLVNVGEPE